MIDPSTLRFADQTNRSIDLVNKIDSLDKTLAVFKSVPVIQTPPQTMDKVRKTIHSMSI